MCAGACLGNNLPNSPLRLVGQCGNLALCVSNANDGQVVVDSDVCSNGDVLVNLNGAVCAGSVDCILEVVEVLLTNLEGAGGGCGLGLGLSLGLNLGESVGAVIVYDVAVACGSSVIVAIHLGEIVEQNGGAVLVVNGQLIHVVQRSAAHFHEQVQYLLRLAQVNDGVVQSNGTGGLLLCHVEYSVVALGIRLACGSRNGDLGILQGNAHREGLVTETEDTTEAVAAVMLVVDLEINSLEQNVSVHVVLDTQQVVLVAVDRLDREIAEGHGAGQINVAVALVEEQAAALADNGCIAEDRLGAASNAGANVCQQIVGCAGSGALVINSRLEASEDRKLAVENERHAVELGVLSRSRALELAVDQVNALVLNGCAGSLGTALHGEACALENDLVGCCESNLTLNVHALQSEGNGGSTGVGNGLAVGNGQRCGSTERCGNGQIGIQSEGILQSVVGDQVDHAAACLCCFISLSKISVVLLVLGSRGSIGYAEEVLLLGSFLIQLDLVVQRTVDVVLANVGNRAVSRIAEYLAKRGESGVLKSKVALAILEENDVRRVAFHGDLGVLQGQRAAAIVGAHTDEALGDLRVVLADDVHVLERQRGERGNEEGVVEALVTLKHVVEVLYGCSACGSSVVVTDLHHTCGRLDGGVLTLGVCNTLNGDGLAGHLRSSATYRSILGNVNRSTVCSSFNCFCKRLIGGFAYFPRLGSGSRFALGRNREGSCERGEDHYQRQEKRQAFDFHSRKSSLIFFIITAHARREIIQAWQRGFRLQETVSPMHTMIIQQSKKNFNSRFQQTLAIFLGIFHNVCQKRKRFLNI